MYDCRCVSILPILFICANFNLEVFRLTKSVFVGQRLVPDLVEGLERQREGQVGATRTTSGVRQQH